MWIRIKEYSSRISSLFRTRQLECDFDEELRSHLTMMEDDKIRSGMAPDQARRAASLALGNTTQLREAHREVRGLPLLDSVLQDLNYAQRTMRNSPAFTATALLTLALGIGANTAIFTVIRAVLLQPLKYFDPGRLVYFSVENLPRHIKNGSFSLIQLEELRNAQKSLSAIAAYGRPENIMLSGIGEPEALKGARVSANFLDVLGVQPLLGRSFLTEEDKRGGRPVAMIAADLWKRRFQSDPEAVGRSVTFDATPYTIIGVLPDGFEFPFAGAEVWVTRPAEWSTLPPRYWGAPTLTGFARLRPGVTLEEARAEMTVLERQYTAVHPNPIDSDANTTMRMVLLRDQLVGDVSPMLWTLFGAVGLVLLIACANVASLLLARATSRSREFAVRASLGAPRSRIVRQLLLESLLLAALGGLAGVMFASWGLGAIAHTNLLFAPTGINTLYVPGAGDIGMDGTVLWFTLAISVLTGGLFGLVPSIRASRSDLANALRDRGSSEGRATAIRGLFGFGTRDLLVAGQIALSVVLLIGAGLLMKSFVRLHSVDPGFQSSNLLTAKISLPLTRYDTEPKREMFYRNLLSRLEGLRETRGAAMVTSLPTTAWIRTNFTDIEGLQSRVPDRQSSYAVLQSVTPTYFQTLGIPLRRGREFTNRDNSVGAPPVMIVNESLARTFWPDYENGVSPVGRHVKEGYDKAAGWIEIVGVVADIHEGGLDGDAVPEFYVPFVLHPPQAAYVAVRADGNPLRLASTIRSEVLSVDPDQPVSEVKTMEGVLDSKLGQRRLTMLLLATFAGLALLLAVVGIYGVIAYSVARRTQEIGVRCALGAGRSDILQLVLRQGLILALVGVTVGIGAALGLTRVVKRFLFGVNATDLSTFVGVGSLFVVVALAASLLPAWRATKIHPAEALRVS